MTTNPKGQTGVQLYFLMNWLHVDLDWSLQLTPTAYMARWVDILMLHSQAKMTTSYGCVCHHGNTSVQQS